MRRASPDPRDAPSALVPNDVNYWRRAADVALSDVGLRRPSLDDVFLALTGRKAEPAASEPDTDAETENELAGDAA